MPRKVRSNTNTLLKHFVLLCVFMCAHAGRADASSLFGKVIDVNSGDVITVFNLNRPVRVRLLGVDAPEMNQPFGDVAKKHLADLVFDKSVLVEYSGIGPDSSLSGRVLLGSSDVGAQMIRDGAAWVDPGNRHRLTATDREVYQQSEQAARSERRGLWQDENPIAPWEFVKAVAPKRTQAASLNVVGPVSKRVEGPTPEFTSFSLIASRLAAAAEATKSTKSSDFASFLPSVDGGNWRLLRPAREKFSVLVPEAGEQESIPVTADRMIDGQLYRGRDGRSGFVVYWGAAPTYGESDLVAIKSSITHFLRGFKSSVTAANPGPGAAFSCELQDEKDISINGFTGVEFDLSSCTIPARARVFTRTVDGKRQLYLATVFYMQEDDNVARFINSFTITPAKLQKSTKRTK